MEGGIFAIDAWGDPVGAGATQPHYCTLGGVVKRNPAASPFVVANEFICGRLALMLGLPVPPGVIVELDDGSRGYVALRFGKRGERPPPVNAEHLVEDEPMVAAGIVALDCWVGNTDRNEGNVSYSRGALPPVLFDHSHALIGEGQDLARLNSVDQPQFGGVIAPLLTEGAHLVAWAERVDGIPAPAVEHVCMDAARNDAITEEQAEETAEFLKARKPRIMDLLQHAASPTTNVQWPLEGQGE